MAKRKAKKRGVTRRSISSKKTKGGAGMMSKDCPKWACWVILIAGVLYALQDFGIASLGFWTANWWTVAFVVAGLAGAFSK